MSCFQFQGAKVVGAVDEDREETAAASTAAAGARRSAEAGMKMKVILRGLVHTARKTFERSIPAVRFGHVAYMR
jgi:hypothetical protein